MKTTTATILGAFAATAAAHGTVNSFIADGKKETGFLLDYYYAIQNGQTPPATAGWYAENLDNGFVSPDAYGTADIACHKNAKAATTSSTVAAGGEVTFQWSDWPHGLGPMLTYVAKCDGDCADADKTALKWVKIDEKGINLETQKWAAQEMIDNDSKWTVTVPSTLAAGNYVFRHETIAMHGAGDTNGAQNYPQCINIAITGSGTDNPEGVVATELYTADHPGIKFNPYTTLTSYEIPGPALYGSGGNGGSTPTTPTTPTTPEESTAPTTPVTTPSPTTEPATPSEPATPTTPPTTGDDTCQNKRRKARKARKARRSTGLRAHSRQFRM